MLYRHRLRTRIILSFTLLGFILAALFAGSVLVLRSRIENQLISTWLQREAENFVRFKRAHPEPDAAYELSAQRIEMWIYRPGNPKIPANWRGLQSGVYDMHDPGDDSRDRNYKLGVDRESDIVGFIRYSFGRQSLQMQQLLVLLGAAVVLFTALAFVVGMWSSQRVMRPVADLARRIKAFRGSTQPEKLAPHFTNDEVGQLADTLDHYAERLTHLVQRDREFNADVSHELRTPLSVIKGSTELLLSSPDISEKTLQRLRRIERATQQSTHLITALLMLSRNERGTGDCNLLQLAEQLVDANRAQLTGKPVQVRAEGDADAYVNAPESVLSVAIGNLIGNACKYTAEGEVVVKVAADCVMVIDSGPGISAEDAAHLFDRGFRGKSSTGTKGAGIGLSIVSRLCELYGWKVAIAPRTDARGSVATLSFDPANPC
jgi:signal transduction histidine kinase